MKLLKYSLLMIVLLSMSSCMSISKYNYSITQKRYPIDALNEDVDLIFNSLKKKHPGVYWYISEEALNGKIDSLKNSFTDPLTSKEFYLRVAPIVASINCGHTRLYLSSTKKTKGQENKKTSLLKQNTFFVNDSKLYFKSISDLVQRNSTGSEILSINDCTTDKIVENLKKYIPSDGYNQTFKYELLNRNFASLYEQIYGVTDTLNFEISDSTNVRSIHLTKQSFKKETKSKIVVNKKEKLDKKIRYKGLDENKQAILDYKLIDNSSKTAYLKIKSFSFDHSNFSKFYTESFDRIKEEKVENLILDLRDNGGGSLKASRTLFSYLTDSTYTYLKPVETKGRFTAKSTVLDKLFSPTNWLINRFLFYKKDGKYYAKVKGTKPLNPKKDNFKGNLYVITNGLSFSASSLLAANLKGLERVTFVGTETGGGFNQCVAGRLPIVKLPNTGLKLRYGLYVLSPTFQSEVYGRGVFPDIIVNKQKEDYLQNRDIEVDTIVKMIKN